MDYKLFIQDLENNKKGFIDYILSTNKKNLVKVESLDNDYINNINNGDYSIKSYKAKIIHNELEHSRVRREIGPLKEEVIQKNNDLIETYFNEYLEEIKNLNIFSSKNKDLREFIQNNRRQKHDVLLKKNNTEKEFNLRTKDFEIGKNDLISEYNDKISDLKIKLSNNLKKSNDKTIKEFQEYETTLLDCNDRQEIKNIKEKIKNVRLIGLDEEYNFKVETYQTILEEELKYNQKYFDFVLEYENYKKEVQNKLAEYEKINTELNLSSELRDNSYQYELKREKLDLLLFDCEKFVENVNKHNQKINLDYSNSECTIEEKMFLFDIIEVNLYRLLLATRRNNIYDPLIYVYTNLVDSLLNLKSSFKDVYQNIVDNKKDYQDRLVTSLDSYVPESKKKTSKEELIENVLTSLDRYFINFQAEVDSFLKYAFDFYMNLINKIIILYDSLQKDNKIADFGKDSFIQQTNYKFVDLKEYGYIQSDANYNFKGFMQPKIDNEKQEEFEEVEITLDLDNVIIEDSFESFKTDETVVSDDALIEKDDFLQTLEESLLKMENEIRVYCNSEFQEIENRINELNAIKNKKVMDSEDTYKNKVKDTDKKHKQSCDLLSNEKIDRDKEIKKLTAKYITNAKNLLSKSTAML